MSKSKWRVGQEVFVHESDSRRGQDYHISISKVGTKWITCGHGYRTIRFDPKSGAIDGKGFSSPGDVYESESIYSEKVRMWTLNRTFSRELEKRGPFKSEQILEAAKCLGIVLEAEMQAKL
jgi:hypothetical protein